ncbi:PREDICTED: uncharacterized protein LOC109244255 [Nicotiana attenuata]|uniref:uncharacterized protein LOC109244255 n=1 Tax=Nicotiana attenuata TaxID=49451 RepID=UPI000904F136|nr:PREDICTED: uncharacterized protein LOC109244255 [Nicotiana attenuata]
MLFEEEPTIENRFVLQKARLELKKYLSIEEQYWKQKAGLNWFAEGDGNTSFFHNHVNGKRKKLQLKRIQNSSGVWIENQEQMADVANMELSRLPTFEEVKGAVFELSGESAGGPGGFTGLFYQSCWDIVGRDIHNMVMHFYGGATHPKSITHTNLVLLPKKLRVETFSDLRPISLSNFTNKVVFRVLHDKLEKFLPLLISPNHSGFVKGRSIFENILLTQEIVTDIRLRGKPANVVIKLDMAKAYDRVSWKYLLHALRRMGFSWKQISLTWFRIWCQTIAYADDTIIFASTHPPSLSKIMKVLGDYEKVSGQMINKAKSSYYMFAKVAHGLVQVVGDITGFTRGKFHFTYLGCPIFYTRRRKEYYEDFIKKVKAKLHSWKGLGALYHVLPEDFPINEDLQDVAELRLEGTWNEHLLEQNFTEEIDDHVRSNVHYEGSEEH